MPETIPYIVNQPTSSICSSGLDAQILTGIFLQIIRAHFSKAENIEEEKLKGYIWVGKPPDYIQPDPENTKILIEPVYRFAPVLVQQLPAILIRRNSLRPQVIALAENLQQPVGQYIDDDMPGRGDERVTPIVGSYSFFCVAREGAAVELLGKELFLHFLEFGPIIRREFGLAVFDLQELTQVFKLEESHEHLSVVLTIQLAFFQHWRVTKQTPRMMGISINTKPV